MTFDIIIIVFAIWGIIDISRKIIGLIWSSFP